jgi:AcrR family transcriptional regulator
VAEYAAGTGYERNLAIQSLAASHLGVRSTTIGCHRPNPLAVHRVPLRQMVTSRRRLVNEMSPRKYRMVTRAGTVDQTRQRIIDATVQAHHELGIQATSWDEIARRAGVGVGTVYRHFRSLEELLPACGQTVEHIMALPTVAGITAAFENTRSLRARVGRLVCLVFELYERAAPFIHNIRGERDQLPQLEPWHQQIQTTLDNLVNEALLPFSPTRPQRETTRALLDLSSWQAFKQRDLSRDEIIQAVAQLIYTAVRFAPDPATRKPTTPGR